MDNYIKTIINGLKAWVSGEIDQVKRYITQTIGKQCENLQGNVDRNTARVETMYHLPRVKCPMHDTSVTYFTHVENWETIDREAPFILFYDGAGNRTLGFRDSRDGTYYGTTTTGRRVWFNFVEKDEVSCTGLGTKDSLRTLVNDQVWNTLNEAPPNSSGEQPYVLAANQGFELQKQITALTERVAALEGATT